MDHLQRAIKTYLQTEGPGPYGWYYDGRTRRNGLRNASDSLNMLDGAGNEVLESV